MARTWRFTGLLIVSALLLTAIWLGLKEGWDGLSGAETILQRIAASFQIAYGLAALAVLMGLWKRSSWLGVALVTWIGAFSITGTLAPVAWGNAAWSAGALGGALTLAASLLVAWAVGALARRSAGTPGHLGPRDQPTP